MKNNFFVLLIIFVTHSCKDIRVEKTSADAILEEELTTFKWNEVDTYPTFSFCDSLDLKARKNCFENELLKLVQLALSKHEIKVSKNVSDTVLLHLQISKKGSLQISNIFMDDFTAEQIPILDSMLRRSLDSVPKIYPAIKRGQQVNTKFVLPIAIEVR